MSRTYSYGQAVVWRPDGGDAAFCARIVGRSRVERKPDESYADARKRAGEPYDIAVLDRDTRYETARANELEPLANLPHPVDAERFGDTPESACRWLTSLQGCLEVSDEWGHRFGATADPHYWGVIDVVDRIAVPDGYDYDYRLFTFDDDPSEPYRALQALEHIVEGLADDEGNLAQLKQRVRQIYRDIVHDDQAELLIDIRDGVLETRYVDDEGRARYGLQARSAANAGIMTPVPDETVDDIVLKLYEEDASYDWNEGRLTFSLGFAEATPMLDIMALLPNQLFLTRDDCRDWIEHNRHNLTGKAHPYLMCAQSDERVTRLWRILRQVDWSSSTLVMKSPTIRYPG